MSESKFRAPLVDLLRKAELGEIPQGWLYLPAGALTPTTEGLVLTEEVASPEAYAAENGFPNESLDTTTLESIMRGARHLVSNPADQVLLRAFEYYCDFDAFLPAVDAPDPPSNAEILSRSDQEFYASLGEERPNTKCREDGCVRGTVQFSVFCRRHHFQSIKRRPWPGAD